MRDITLQQILDAREARAAEQVRILQKYRCPLVSFSMNIAGPVKRTPLIERAFSCGQKQLQTTLKDADATIMYQAESRKDTGCEAFYAVDLDAKTLKSLCVAVEETSPIGRLFDMDVLDVNGIKLERGYERACLVCGKTGAGCASRRLHDVAELQAATYRIMTSHFLKTDAETVSESVTDALLEEVDTTPKPGLVDRNNNGSHRDMTRDTFKKSAEALRGYWSECFLIGQKTQAQSPDETFLMLREAGKAADEAMYRATGGVNTHKGSIYILGVVCGAVGRLWKPEKPFAGTDAILAECAELTREASRADFVAAAAKPEAELTVGERLYVQSGLTGIRGEVSEGFPSVRDTSLPLFQKLLNGRLDRNRAGSITLLALIALGKDTNMIHRGGPEAAEKAAEQVRALLGRQQLPDESDILSLDRDFIAKNLSPGGCADLLALTYFLNILTQPV